MYTIAIVDHLNAVVELTLEGTMDLEEVRRGHDDLRRVLVGLRGRRFKILADVRRLRPLAPAVADEFRSMQEYARKAGLVRAAQLVEGGVVALQRSRITREAGTSSRTRSFKDRDEALDWLIRGDDALVDPARG
jgi:hypothetical protein